MSQENKNSELHDDKLMDHEYDGIKELDNPPPRWIMAIFYITIGWSILYAAYFFWLKVGDDQDAEYVRKSQKHEQKFQMVNMSSDDLVLLTDAEAIDEGKAIYGEMNCFACHGMNGEGNAIGPNLTDEYSISGCDFKSVFNIIKNGNPAKGMTAFKGQLSDERIQKVSSYVITLKGTNPANAKAAQGEKCEE
ncbi:MAG: c-type cytochrome [Prolixibacteraceae bacterium]|nr:c-type cytochrome [Prolixibacteraceae bacterium]MBT6007281.1 c-type cytochrome [Prolixibacteraceae bacterium]MBT6763776.1 c-type cytochrome [Prolixibacteraceae bacterium]MBT7001033.1 c-type cytochrome [Prolixibacteraceae bacterium]MBT7393679.1 c-type cytochrome [Prolixibacteraceae bacterium]